MEDAILKGEATGETATWTGVLAKSDRGTGLAASGGNLAGLFVGSVEITQNLRVLQNVDVVHGDVRLTNGDLAGEFVISDADYLPAAWLC